jgi:hypothetical protein
MLLLMEKLDELLDAQIIANSETSIKHAIIAAFSFIP